MRLAVLSDIHGNYTALQAVLADLQAAGGADQTWVLGDLAAFCPEPVECIEAVRALPQATTKVIQGNTDRYLFSGRRPAWQPPTEESWPALQQETLPQRDANFAWTSQQLQWAHIEYLMKLPTELSLEVPGYGWVIGFHAVPGDDEPALLPDAPADEARDWLLDREGSLAFYGHIHRAYQRDLGDWLLVNVGSVGLPMDGDQRAAYAIATFEDDRVHVELRRVEYDVQRVLDKLQAINHPAIDFAGTILKTARPPA